LVLKRGFDVLLATMGLVVLAPLFPLATLAIRLGSPGPVIFSQRRAGRGAAPFTMFKLRTMFADAEAAGLVDVEDRHRAAAAAKKLREPAADAGAG